MNIDGFIDLVRKMRRAQLDYYRDKYKVYSKLILAKNLEKQVDEALRKGIEVLPTPTKLTEPTATQTTLFMEADDETEK